MKHFTHSPDAYYRVMEGVRRAKAAQLFGHRSIRAEIVDASGRSFGEGDLPIDSLRSPKILIRRMKRADETRWTRVVADVKQAFLPYPPITVQPCGNQGIPIEDVAFDFGDNP